MTTTIDPSTELTPKTQSPFDLQTAYLVMLRAYVRQHQRSITSQEYIDAPQTLQKKS